MKQMIIYALTFMAVVLPTVFFGMLSNRTPGRRAGGEELPLLFRLIHPITDLMEAVGVGTLCRKLLPGYSQALQKKLSFAGVKLSVGSVCCAQIFLTLFCGVVACGVTALLVEPENRISIPIAGLIAALVGGSQPGILIGNLAQKRRLAILRAIPYSIDLIASAMRGGLDFSAAIRFYVKLGIAGPLTDADRIQIKEFTSFAAAVALGTELGAPLTETMEIQGEEMRKARFALAECKAQRAPSLMLLPMALFILPAVFIIILTPVFLKMREAGVPLF